MGLQSDKVRVRENVFQNSTKQVVFVSARIECGSEAILKDHVTKGCFD